MCVLIYDVLEQLNVSLMLKVKIPSFIAHQLENISLMLPPFLGSPKMAAATFLMLWISGYSTLIGQSPHRRHNKLTESISCDFGQSKSPTFFKFPVFAQSITTQSQEWICFEQCHWECVLDRWQDYCVVM